MDISLDVEGVLSNTHEVAYERGEDLDHSMLSEWHFPSDDDYDQFMHVSQNLWHNHTHLIPPMEDPEILRSATRRLSRGDTVDVVTHRHNVDRQVKQWLSAYHVEYEEFHTPSAEKNELDYDVYIDDKPALAEYVEDEQSDVILLRDRPYNSHVEETDRVRRISSLAEAAEMLTDQDTRMEIASLCGAVRDVARVHREKNKDAYVAMGKV